MPILRAHTGVRGETRIEVFFDLVFAFAVTQLSHFLLDHTSIERALQTVLLLAMVWLAWSYTAWLTNWLDPDRPAVRVLLLALMLVSLILSAGIPGAFGDRGLAVGGAYAGMQIGRSVFAVIALHGETLRRNYERILAWCIVSGCLAVAGGLAHGTTRELLWLLTVGVDVAGSVVGFYVPGLGRSTTREWNIEGGHMAQRCQSFVLIALGESIVVIGAGLSGLANFGIGELTAMVVAFSASVGMWWVYFDRSAEVAESVIATSKDPGRLGRSAYHSIHPVMIGGIIAVAAGDHAIVAHPGSAAGVATALMLVGGSAIFLTGHAMFKVAVWHVRPWSRIVAIAFLVVFSLVAPFLPNLIDGAIAAAAVLGVGISDPFLSKRHERTPRRNAAQRPVARSKSR
ncbi:MAG: low temperature requirement protein A [Candidatus Dormibacteraeota bacterium]|nr:low temperature requirement protein A [Candidatus Dormibacteraeota bacterium]